MEKLQETDYKINTHVKGGRTCRARAPKQTMSVIWNATRCVSVRLHYFSSFPRAPKRLFMSYNPHKKRGGGPNRGGGRGRGRGGGRGGGPPQGLSGRDIGMYYRKKGLAKKEEREKNEV